MPAIPNLQYLVEITFVDGVPCDNIGTRHAREVTGGVKQLIPKQKRLESVTLGDIDLLTNTHRMKDERTDRPKQQCKGNIGKTDEVSDIHESISLQLPANYRYLFIATYCINRLF
jgi:hypothetical protein